MLAWAAQSRWGEGVLALLGWAGLGYAGLYWAVLGYAGLGWVGLCWTASALQIFSWVREWILDAQVPAPAHRGSGGHGS